MDTSHRIPVTLERCSDYTPENVERALECALAPLGGMAALLGDARRVILKTNFLTPGPAADGHTTHPAVVEAVAKSVLACGERRVVIADSPAMGSARRVARRNGVGEVARRLGIEIWSLNQPRRVDLPPGEAEWRHLVIDRRLIEPGTRIINLPKAKVHGQMYVTLAIKNLFGAICGKRKPLWHVSVDADRVRFGRMLVWLHRVIQPALHVIDCIDAMERKGPRGGDMRRVGLIAASCDAAALDRVIVEVLGLDPERHHALVAARQLGMGATELDEISVLGEAIDAVRVEGFQEARQTDLAFHIPRPLRFLMLRVLMRGVPQHDHRPS
ncbi:DUF362 domain-containing protein [Candidatus Sumerlaeota bacterium]|nr:DUF362 domain-containing protein [Candidatus Sumerlaeota bacterium]